MSGVSYKVDIEEPSAKLYRINNPGVQTKPHNFTLVKQANGERQLISNNRLYEAASCDSRDTTNAYNYYMVDIDKGSKVLTLTPAVPVSLYLRPTHEETVDPVLQHVASGRPQAAYTLREAVNFFRTKEFSMTKDKTKSAIMSSMISTSTVAELGRAILEDSESELFCNEYARYPPFNVRTPVVSEVFPLDGLLCISVADYCMVHVDTISQEYWSNFVRNTADSGGSSAEKEIGSESSRSHNNSDSDSDSSGDTSTDTSDSTTNSVSQKAAVKPAPASTTQPATIDTSKLEFTPFAIQEKKRFSEMGCNRISPITAKPIYEASFHFEKREGIYYYTISGLVQQATHRGTFGNGNMATSDEIIEYVKNFKFTFTYSNSRALPGIDDSVSIQILEQCRANLLRYANTVSFDTKRLHDLASLLMVLYELLLYIMHADKHSAPVVDFISGRLGCSLGMYKVRMKIEKEVLPPYICVILLHFNDYTADPQQLAKALRLDMYLVCKLCTNLFCKRIKGNTQQYQLKTPVVSSNEDLKRKRGMYSMGARIGVWS